MGCGNLALAAYYQELKIDIPLAFFFSSAYYDCSVDSWDYVCAGACDYGDSTFRLVHIVVLRYY